MGKKSQFVSMSLLVIAGRFYDACTTAIYTPDLKHEGNPLVHYLGAGWTALILIQIFITSLVVYGLWFYSFKFKTVMPYEKGLTLKQYISFFFFYNTYSFSKVLYKSPVNKAGLMAIFGYVSATTLIFASYLVGTSTTFLIISPAYKPFYKLGIPYAIIGISVMAMLFFTLRFFRLEYRKYQSAISTRPSAN